MHNHSTLIITILRIPILLSTNFHDLTFDVRNQLIVLAEPAAALIVSCSPILRPVFDKFFKRVTGRTTRQGTNATGDSRHPPGYHTIGGRSNLKAKSHGYNSFGDSDELLEMGSVAKNDQQWQQEQQETTITAMADLKHRSNQDRGELGRSGGIVVKKETIVSI